MKTWPMHRRNNSTFRNDTHGRTPNRRGLFRQKPITSVPDISVTDTSAENMENYYDQDVLKIVAIGNPNNFNKSEKWNSLICDLLSKAYVICPTERSFRNGHNIDNIMLNSHAAVFIMTKYSVNDAFSLQLLQQAKASKLVVVSVRDPSFNMSFSKHYERPRSARFGTRKRLITNIQSTSMEKIRGEQNGRTLNHNMAVHLDVTNLACMINVLRFEFENSIVFCKSTSMTSNLILKRVYEIQNGAKKHKMESDPLLQADDNNVMDNANFLRVPSSLGNESSLFSPSETSFDERSESEISLQIPESSPSSDLGKMDPERKESVSTLSPEDVCKMEDEEEEEEETCFWVFPDKTKHGDDVAPKLIRWPHNVDNVPFDQEWKSESSTGFQDIDLSILLSSSSSLTERYSDEDDIFN